MTSLESISEALLGKVCTLDHICSELAKLFNVRRTEIGVLRVEGELLRFVHHVELNSAGCIPICGSAVAARTAAFKTSVVHNNFANVPHHDVFELVKLKDPQQQGPDDPQRIQKLISLV